MFDLDKKDRLILAQLDQDARLPYSKLSQEVSLSQEGVRYRVERLEDTVIKDYVTVLNHAALGRQAYRIFFRFQDLTDALEAAFVNLVENEAAWVVRSRGPWSFNTMFFADDPYAVEALLQDIHEEFPEKLLDEHVSMITRIYHYPRAFYLPEKETDRAGQVMGREADVRSIDEKDQKVLRSLRRNARQKTIEVARDTGLSERVVRYRMKQLEDADVILGYRALPDLEALDMLYYKVHISLNQHDEATRRQLKAYARSHPNIVYLTQAVGGPDLELEYQVESSRELYGEIDALVAENPGLVQDYTVLLYDKEYQLSYFNKVSKDVDDK